MCINFYLHITNIICVTTILANLMKINNEELSNNIKAHLDENFSASFNEVKVKIGALTKLQDIFAAMDYTLQSIFRCNTNK